MACKSFPYYKGQFCYNSSFKREHGQIERKYIPMDPQPESNRVIVVHRYYTALKADKLYWKRVTCTWLGEEGLNSRLAVVEYSGVFPGLAPNGNSKDLASEYLRPPDFVMTEIKDMLQTDKPQMIYAKRKKKYDEVKQATGMQI